MLLQLAQVQRYRARYQMRDGTSVVAERATLDGIYSRIAWWLIVDKYGDLPPIMEFRGLECRCRRWDDYTGHSIHDNGGPIDCPLHDRRHGYFRRMHDRIARWLQAGYINLEES